MASRTQKAPTFLLPGLALDSLLTGQRSHHLNPQNRDPRVRNDFSQVSGGKGEHG